MRKFLPLVLLLVSVAVPAVRAAGEEPVPPPTGREERERDRVAELRAQLKGSVGSGAWETTARELLAALDRSGAASEIEIVKLTDGLLALSPDDATLRWRRGNALRRLGQDERALADLQKLIQLAPDSPYAVRARRALPALYLRVGLAREAAQADEELLAQKLVDPVAVLPRLAQTYSKLGQPTEVRATVERLRAIDRERANADRDLAWLEADAIERLGPPAEASSVMLAFAARFPDDRRRGEALVRAARARGDLGDLEPAIEIAGRAIAEPLPPAAAQGTRVARAELLERAGRSKEAGEDFRSVLATSFDPGMIDRVLSRYVDIELERRGTEGAVIALAAVVAEGRPAVAGPARQRMAVLLDGLAASREVPAERAAFVVQLVEKADPELEIPPALRLAAAQLWEGVGDCARASNAYLSLVLEDPPVNREAGRGLARCRPQAQPPGLPADSEERLAALRREQRWDVARELVKTVEDGKGPPDGGAGTQQLRALAARAAFAANDAAGVREALEPLPRVDGETALLRGDFYATQGDWTRACRDYDAARAAIALAYQADWLEVRLAECEARRGDAKAARVRLAAVIEGKPAEPVASAAALLLPRLSALAGAALRGSAR